MKRTLGFLVYVLGATACITTPIGGTSSRKAPSQDRADRVDAQPQESEARNEERPRADDPEMEPGAGHPTDAAAPPARGGIEQFPGSKLFMPQVTPAPGIILLHGSEGGDGETFLKDFAAELAKQGFATIAFCWFGCPGTPPKVLRAPLERVVDAGRWLEGSPDVKGGVGAVRMVAWCGAGRARDEPSQDPEPISRCRGPRPERHGRDGVRSHGPGLRAPRDRSPDQRQGPRARLDRIALLAR